MIDRLYDHTQPDHDQPAINTAIQLATGDRWPELQPYPTGVQLGLITLQEAQTLESIATLGKISIREDGQYVITGW